VSSTKLVLRRIEIGLERVDGDLDRGVGVRAPQFAAVEHDGVEPLRIVALVDCDRVRERVAAVHELDDAETAAGRTRSPSLKRAGACGCRKNEPRVMPCLTTSAVNFRLSALPARSAWPASSLITWQTF